MGYIDTDEPPRWRTVEAGPLTIHSARAVDVHILRLVGQLESTTIGAFEVELAEAESTGATVIVDLRRARFIDVDGIAALEHAERRLREAGGRLDVLNATVEVDRMRALAHVDRVFAVFDWT